MCLFVIVLIIAWNYLHPRGDGYQDDIDLRDRDDIDPIGDDIDSIGDDIDLREEEIDCIVTLRPTFASSGHPVPMYT